MNEEQKSIILQTKNFPRRLLIHCYVEFSQNVDWKVIAMISLKMRNPGFEIFFRSGFSDGNHCLKLPCSISKDSQAFQLNCGTKHLTIDFDFRGPAVIYLVKFFLGHPVSQNSL